MWSQPFQHFTNCWGAKSHDSGQEQKWSQPFQRFTNCWGSKSQDSVQEKNPQLLMSKGLCASKSNTLSLRQPDSQNPLTLPLCWGQVSWRGAQHFHAQRPSWCAGRSWSSRLRWTGPPVPPSVSSTPFLWRKGTTVRAVPTSVRHVNWDSLSSNERKNMKGPFQWKF